MMIAPNATIEPFVESTLFVVCGRNNCSLKKRGGGIVLRFRIIV